LRRVLNYYSLKPQQNKHNQLIEDFWKESLNWISRYFSKSPYNKSRRRKFNL